MKILRLILSTLLVLGVMNCVKKEADRSAQKEQNIQYFYIGTYTNGDSEGIYKYSLDDQGNLEQVGIAAQSENPSFLALARGGKVLVAVNEVKNEAGVGTVESFLVTEEKLKLLNRRSSGGAHPCFVAVKEDLVLTANYTGGNVGLLKLDTQGRLSEPLFIQQHEGNGTTDRQLAPHAHSVWFKPASDEVMAVDLGTNELWISTLDRDTDSLSPPDRLAFEAGAGPRHLAFHPNGKWIYVINELDNTISMIQKHDNGYQLHESFSTLPADFAGESFTAHLLISSDGKFLYASNRGHNSIAVFKIEENGDLILKGHKSTGGEWPRHFTLSPDEKFLLVANQHSNNIVALKRNPESGMLRYKGEISAPTPVCLVFLPEV